MLGEHRWLQVSKYVHWHVMRCLMYILLLFLYSVFFSYFDHILSSASTPLRSSLPPYHSTFMSFLSLSQKLKSEYQRQENSKTIPNKKPYENLESVLCWLATQIRSLLQSMVDIPIITPLEKPNFPYPTS